MSRRTYLNITRHLGTPVLVSAMVLLMSGSAQAADDVAGTPLSYGASTVNWPGPGSIPKAIISATRDGAPLHQTLVTVAGESSAYGFTNCSRWTGCRFNSADKSQYATGANPSAIALAQVRPTSSFAFITNSGSGTLTLLKRWVPGEFTEGDLVTVPIGGEPTGIAASPDGDRVYVADSQRNLLIVLETRTQTPVSSVAVPAGPWGVGVSPDGSRLYVTSLEANVVVVLDSGTLSTIATIPVGIRPANIAVAPDGATAYVTNNGSDTVSVVNLVTNEVISTVTVGSQPWGLALDSFHVFVADFGSDAVSVIDRDKRAVVATVRTGDKPFGVAIEGGEVLVTNSGDGTITSIPLTPPIVNLSMSGSLKQASITAMGALPTGLRARLEVRWKGGKSSTACVRKGNANQVTCVATQVGAKPKAWIVSSNPWGAGASGTKQTVVFK